MYNQINNAKVKDQSEMQHDVRHECNKTKNKQLNF